MMTELNTTKNIFQTSIWVGDVLHFAPVFHFMGVTGTVELPAFFDYFDHFESIRHKIIPQAFFAELRLRTDYLFG